MVNNRASNGEYERVVIYGVACRSGIAHLII